MKKVIIITGSELRHVFFCKFIALDKNIKVINTYCEGREKGLRVLVEEDKVRNDIRSEHLFAREQSEEDFFRLFVEASIDESNSICLPKGDINKTEYVQAIIDSKPDLLIAFGCSLIREPLLNAFPGRFLNVHLGLSPYYRGSGTNYWPLVRAEPEYVGATFMHMDSGIDTGEIIHQIRADFFLGDSPAQIGNRLILKMSFVYRNIIVNFESLAKMSQLRLFSNGKVYKKKDFTEDSVSALYRNFENNLVEKYLNEKTAICANVPILINPALGV